MTDTNKLFAILWFFLAMPAMLVLVPTDATLVIVTAVSVAFGLQVLVRLTWRCNECGHFTSFLRMPRKWRFLVGETTCGHCGHQQRRIRPYVRKLT